MSGEGSQMRLEIDGVQRVLRPEALVVIGYAGRDRAAVEAHISELAELGVPRPASVPLFMAFPPRLICQAPRVEAAGGHTSGEAEVVLAVDGDDVFVTVGSDHTDRALEAVDIVASKGVCPKPVAAKGWPAAALNGRWDGLRLRSRIDDGYRTRSGAITFLKRLAEDRKLEAVDRKRRLVELVGEINRLYRRGRRRTAYVPRTVQYRRVPPPGQCLGVKGRDLPGLLTNDTMEHLERYEYCVHRGERDWCENHCDNSSQF